MFIGRENEIKIIKEALLSNKQEAILLYGRRRVGKTYLVNEVLKEIKDFLIISYTFRDTLIDINIEEFSIYVANLFNDKYFKSKNLKEILNYIKDKSLNNKVILFLDEYSFLRKNNSGIDSYFQIFIDENISINKFKFIFSGSYMDIMESIIEKENAPLFGRFTKIIKLDSFDYLDTAKYLSSLDLETKFKYYATFGGLPFTLSLIDLDKSIEDNLKELILKKDSIIEREINYYLSNEFKKDSNASFILELIGKGKHKFKDLENELRMYNGGINISYIINKLLDLNLIKKEIHVNEKIKNTYYYINDNLFDFYFTFINKNVNIRNNINETSFYEYIKNEYEKEYLPKKFEQVSKEFLLRLNKYLKDPLFYELGTLRINNKLNNVEFDLVSKKNDYLIDYECKYYSRLLSKEDYLKEIEEIKKTNIKFNEVRFFSKYGKDNTFPKDIIVYSLNDIYFK